MFARREPLFFSLKAPPIAVASELWILWLDKMAAHHKPPLTPGNCSLIYPHYLEIEDSHA